MASEHPIAPRVRMPARQVRAAIHLDNQPSSLETIFQKRGFAIMAGAGIDGMREHPISCPA